MRILVTRPEPEAAATAAALAGLGHAVLAVPLLSARAVAPGPLPERIDAVAVTSPRTAAFLPPDVAAALAGKPVFAVGGRTAAALVEAGFSDVRTAGGDVVALTALIREAGLPRGAVVFHPGGEARAGDLAGALAADGLTVAAVSLYRMEPAGVLPPAAADALGAGTLDAVLHYSPASAAAFLRLAEAGGLAAAAAGVLHVCLSEAVAAPLRQAGFSRIAVAARPDEGALFAALAEAGGLRAEGPRR